MEENKDIIIASPRVLYDLMCAHENIIFQDTHLATIKDYLDAAYTGCSCRKKTNEDKAIEVYKVVNINVKKDVISSFKLALGANNLLFFLDDRHLFTV